MCCRTTIVLQAICAEVTEFLVFTRRVLTVSRFKGTLPCARNQLPWKTHEKTKKTQMSKTPKTLDLGVSLQGTTFPKKNQKKSAIRAGPNRCRNDVPFVSEIGLFLF